MNGDSLFSKRVIAAWAAAAVIVFAVSLYFMGGGQIGSPVSVGPSTYSHSAIGHAGIADVLQRLDIPVVKSRSNSLEHLKRGSVLVIAEPDPGARSEEAIRTLLKADTILIVLPKWGGQQSEKKPEWLSTVSTRSIGVAEWTLRLVAPRGDVVREDAALTWTTNTLGLTPNLVAPRQLIRGDRLTPIIGSEKGMLIGEITDRNRKIWILSDPDVIANHGLALPGNAELAVALIERLRGPDGVIVFDETIHGFRAGSSNPFLLIFQFPFVIASLQVAIAAALLLWGAMARFGAPQPAPATLSAGRQALLQNVANLIEFTGHHQVMVRRYVQEMIRDVARQLHAPAELAGEPLLAWLQRVGSARGVDVDCGAIAQRASELENAGRRDQAQLVELARDIYRWKREITDGSSRNPRAH
jgi:hypothetical protein